MADIFRRVDIALMLEKKYIIIMGSSVQRCIYKDLVCLLQQDFYLTDAQLRAKGEKTFINDNLLHGGMMSKMSNGTEYREVREYKTEYHHVKFYFITRCFSAYMKEILEEIKASPVQPDLFIISSCLWDISRYGKSSVAEFKINIVKLMDSLKSTLSEACTVVWNCTLPISSDAKGGVIVPEVETMTSTLRLDIALANHFVQKVVVQAGYDVVDLQFFLRNHIHRRAADGIHWDMSAHRRLTNLLMTHVAEAWGFDIPDNALYCNAVDESLMSSLKASKENEERIKNRPKLQAKRRGPFFGPNVQSTTGFNKTLLTTPVLNDEIWSSNEIEFNPSINSNYYLPSTNTQNDYNIDDPNYYDFEGNFSQSAQFQNVAANDNASFGYNQTEFIKNQNLETERWQFKFSVNESGYAKLNYNGSFANRQPAFCESSRNGIQNPIFGQSIQSHNFSSNCPGYSQPNVFAASRNTPFIESEKFQDFTADNLELNRPNYYHVPNPDYQGTRNIPYAHEQHFGHKPPQLSQSEAYSAEPSGYYQPNYNHPPRIQSHSVSEMEFEKDVHFDTSTQHDFFIGERVYSNLPVYSVNAECYNKENSHYQEVQPDNKQHSIGPGNPHNQPKTLPFLSARGDKRKALCNRNLATRPTTAARHHLQQQTNQRFQKSHSQNFFRFNQGTW